MKKYIILIVAVAMLFSSVLAHSGLIYSKPEFRGRVIDTETKEPIEGAVVVALYYKQSTVSLNPAGTSAYVFAVKETLTDGKGEFYIPSFSSWMIFTEDVGVSFIFFKPGYMAISDRWFETGLGEARIGYDQYLATDVIGKEAELEVYSFREHKQLKWKCRLGIVELKKVSPEKAMPPGGIQSDYGSKQLPLLYNAINKDRKNRGLEGDVK